MSKLVRERAFFVFCLGQDDARIIEACGTCFKQVLADLTGVRAAEEILTSTIEDFYGDPDGPWIWEGTATYDAVGEDDAELLTWGAWRRPTTEEWQSYCDDEWIFEESIP